MCSLSGLPLFLFEPERPCCYYKNVKNQIYETKILFANILQWYWNQSGVEISEMYIKNFECFSYWKLCKALTKIMLIGD